MLGEVISAADAVSDDHCQRPARIESFNAVRAGGSRQRGCEYEMKEKKPEIHHAATKKHEGKTQIVTASISSYRGGVHA